MGVDKRPFSGHTIVINCRELTKDGTQMLSGNEEGTVMLWEINGSTSPVTTIHAHTG